VRICPFHGCGTEIPDEVFACRPHWFSLTAGERSEIWAAYRAWQRGDIDGNTLWERQQAVLGTKGKA
jgi:hypothetical protein